MYRVLFLLSFLSLFLIPLSTSAQVDGSALSPDIAISAVPSNPEPLESVTLTLTSYSVDLNQALIVWRYNGTIISSGTGRKTINIKAPKANTTGLVTATISGAGFSSTTTTFDLRTAKIDLLWEAADSYTPPFYKGKAMLSPNGLIRVTAIPAQSAPKNISFEWSRNDAVVSSASGYNKSSMTFRNETLKQQERISVTATSGLFGGTSTVVITPAKPQLVAYKKQEGFIDYAIGYLSQIPTNATGLTVRFEPYFFSVQHQSIADDLVFTIKNNESVLSGDTRPNEISLSRPDNGGESGLEVSVNTSVYSLQNALKQFTILFK